MEIFISHSSKDKKIADILSKFLESVDYNIHAFYTSRTGSIKSGSDYVKEIIKKLSECDIFIPLITSNYYESRFCMTELGFALANSYLSKKLGTDYIFPLAVPPIKNSKALEHTPLEHLQVHTINKEEGIQAYINDICESKNITFSSGLNRKIHDFVNEANRIIFNSSEVLDSAKILLCKSGNVSGEDHDYLKYSVNMDGNGYTVNFRARPFDNSTKYPDFLSTVFQYIDKINLYDIVKIYDKTKLCFQINNYTNSISKIDIEIKYSDNIRILHRQTIDLGGGINNIVIPLNNLKSEALKQISEICFVIKSSAFLEDEGMFQIKDFSVTHK